MHDSRHTMQENVVNLATSVTDVDVTTAIIDTVHDTPGLRAWFWGCTFVLDKSHLRPLMRASMDMRLKRVRKCG
jgi:hypothetical protein